MSEDRAADWDREATGDEPDVEAHSINDREQDNDREADWDREAAPREQESGSE
jgi:hypothetical protein